MSAGLETEKGGIVRLGDFFFKWRNLLFPLILLGLFMLFRPAATLFGSVVADRVRDVLAGGVIVLGLAVRFATIGWAYIQRGGLKKKVHADTLVTSGYFGLCRNPLYLGNMILYAGVFMLHGNMVVTIAGTALFAFIYTCIIAAEEFYLRGKFGADYAAYCRDVPRWWPVLSRHASVTEGMTFSLNRSLVKDYTTIANTALAVIAIEVLERFWWAGHADFVAALWVAAGLVVVLLAFAALVKWHKKRGAERSIT